MSYLPIEQDLAGRPLCEKFAALLKDNHEVKRGHRAWKLFFDRFPNGVIINQYDKSDILCNTFENFSQIISFENYKDYYYRYDVFPGTSRHRIDVTHLGASIHPIGIAKLTEANYCNTCLNGIIQSRGFRSFCGDKVFDPFILPVYYRFAGKMAQIAALDPEDFNKAVETFCKPVPFHNVPDLSELPKVCGIYVLILDEYKQCYIGKSNDIRHRILQHWSKNDVESGYGINTFRALDTTRILIIPVESRAYNELIDEVEFTLIRSMDEKYLLNIMPGGDWIGDIHDPTSTYM